MTRLRYGVVVAVVTASATTLAALPASAATLAADETARTSTTTSTTALQDEAIAELRASLVTKSTNDAEAAASVKKLDGLSSAQKSELAQYLLGVIVPSFSDPTTSSEGAAQKSVASSGNFSRVSETNVVSPDQSTSAISRAANYNVSSYGDEMFYFAGILISQTRVWADYVTGSNQVLSITNYGCQVLANYDIYSSISTSQAGSSLSGGNATFLCNVVVNRGAPTPWGQITWSTSSGIQYLSVNGPGVTGHGWR